MHYAYIDEVWGNHPGPSEVATTTAMTTTTPLKSVKQARPTMATSPQDPERNVVHNIATYLESMYKTHGGFNKLMKLMPEPFLFEFKEHFTDRQDREDRQDRQPGKTLNISINMDSMLTFVLSVLLVFVFYDALSRLLKK